MTSKDHQSSATPLDKPTPSPLASPSLSREPSPARQLLAPPLLQPKDPRLRQNNDSLHSGNSNNPAHSRPTVPTDSTGKPSQPENQDNGATNGSSALRWPTSPRLKSPPAPTASKKSSSSATSRQTDVEQLEGEPPTQPSRALPISGDSPSRSPVIGPNLASGAKAPRGFSGLTSTLETVQEGDHSSSPSQIDNGVVGAENPNLVDKQQSDRNLSNISPERAGNEAAATPAEVDGGAARNKDGPKNTLQPSTGPKKPGPPMVSAKVRPTAEGSSQSMIVETETVASIPQSSTGVANAERGGVAKRDENGSLRANPNGDPAKLKKDKKRAVTKRPSAASGQITSKADIFEAKVTSAADSDESDSDETFIYESNPTEARPRPPRHHSRTPSANSMRSLAERKPGSRALGSLADSQRGVRAKRSMKFASNSYAADDEGADRDHGTVRANRTKNGSSSGHHHMHGFAPDNHQTTGEEESPFSQASKFRNSTTLHKQRSFPNMRTAKPGSPPPYSRTPTRGDQHYLYDLDRDRSASEQDPLLSSLRAPRIRPGRGSNLRHMEYYGGAHRERQSHARRCAGSCMVVMTVIIVLLVAGGFLFATTHPLYNVELIEIQNILASDESLMMDLKCTATNPNIVSISIGDMDVNIFAKSIHLDPEDQPSLRAKHLRRQHRHNRHGRRLDRSSGDANDAHSLGSVDDGTDPIVEPSTLLLGRILHFDSALTFDASPFQHAAQNVTGGLRLTKPGNTTEADGTERWERLIQFPFDLIIRGVLQYTLPFSSRIITNSVGLSVHVDPDDASDGNGNGSGNGTSVAAAAAIVRAVRKGAGSGRAAGPQGRRVKHMHDHDDDDLDEAR